MFYLLFDCSIFFILSQNEKIFNMNIKPFSTVQKSSMSLSDIGHLNINDTLFDFLADAISIEKKTCYLM